MVSFRAPRSAALLAALATALILGTAAAIAAPGDIQTSLVHNINPNTAPGQNGSAPRDLVNVNGTIFFNANDGTNGEELWKHDGTTTTMLEIFPGFNGSNPAELTNVNGTLFFRARATLTEEALYKLEPPYTTPTKIDINPNPIQSDGVASLANFNGTLFFSANDATGDGVELWKSNGGTVASGGTVMVADVNPTPDEGSFPDLLTPVGNTLFFVADIGSDNEELFKTNGTVGNLTPLEINPAPDEGADPGELTNVGGTLFLTADDGTNGEELWKAGETDTSATLIEIVPGPTASDPEDLGALGSTLFFGANDGVHGYEPWKSNGGSVGSGGTALVADINTTPTIAADSFPEDHTAFSGKIFFIASNGSIGQELWKSNGGPLGAGNTELVADINPGPANPSLSLQDSRIFDGALWFRATSAAIGSELWYTDGTSVRSADISPGPPESVPNWLAAGNDALYFSANDGTSTGIELWKATIEPPPPPPPPIAPAASSVQTPDPCAPLRKKLKKAKTKAQKRKIRRKLRKRGC